MNTFATSKYAANGVSAVRPNEQSRLRRRGEMPSRQYPLLPGDVENR